MATSFYNERDADLSEALVKTLLETHQVIPDFLNDLIPEGFTADGTGDVANLKFEADSDYGENTDNEGEAATGWGASSEAAASEPVQSGQSWGAGPAQTDKSWGTPATVIAQPTPIHHPAAVESWGSAPVAQSAHAKAAETWDSSW